MSLAEDLKAAGAMLELAAVAPSPVGDIARVLAAAAKIGATLAGDGRTVEEIVAHIERADDIAPKVKAGDVAADEVLDERFGHDAGGTTPATPAPANPSPVEPEGGHSPR